MIDSHNLKIDFSNLNVSRETLIDLENYSKEIIKRNKRINLISKSTEKTIKSRHILDSAQTLDFVDKKDISVCTDLGSGAGLPGIVLSILIKSKKPMFRVIFFEKSYHKANFLREMSNKFNLNTEIHQKNIFEEKNLITDVIICRAFKPLPIIFDIAITKFKKFKYIILFLGKSGQKILKEAEMIWKFDCEKKISLTNNESMIVKIKNLRKKNV